MSLNEIWKLPANAIAVPGVDAGRLPTQLPVICVDSRAQVGSGFSVGGSSYSGSGAVSWHGKSTETSATNLDCIKAVTAAEKDLREVDVEITDIRAGVDRDRAVLGTGNPALQTVVVQERYKQGIDNFMANPGFYTTYVNPPAPQAPVVTPSKAEHKAVRHTVRRVAADTITVTAPAGTSIRVGCTEQCPPRPAGTPASAAAPAAATPK